MAMSQRKPLVMKILAPLMTYSSPSSLARALDALQVRARARLGHGDGGHGLAAGHLRQPVLLLRGRAEVDDVVGDDVRVQREAAGRVTHARLLLHEDHGVEAVHARPAELGGHGAAQQAQLTGLVPQVAVDVLLRLPLLLVRGDLGLEEAARGGAEGLVVLGEQGARHHGSHGLRDVQVAHAAAP
jgi:hypothetical protein